MKIPCKVYDESRNTPQDFVYAHAKLDGNFIEVIVNKNSGVRVYSSNDIDLTDQVREQAWYKRLVAKLWTPINFGLVVCGELWIEGQPASEIRSAIAGNGEHVDALKFTAFAVTNTPADWIAINSQDLPAVTDFMLNTLGLDTACYCRVLSHDTLESLKQRLESRSGYSIEGIVFKNGHLDSWTKWKPVKTIDARVTGWKPGKGKYAGQVGSLVVGVYHNSEIINIANVGGFTNEVRLQISVCMADRNLGRVIEVAYQCVGSQGSLRHPRFIRFRDDKAHAGCSSEQDPELLRVLNSLSE